MSVIENMKKWFQKGTMQMGMGKEINSLTDDPRVSMSKDDYQRILLELQYYRDDNQHVSFHNSNGVKKSRIKHTSSITRQAGRAWASLIFDEKAKITVNSETKAGDGLNDYIADVLNHNNFYDLYEEWLELGVVAGGFAVFPQVVNDEIQFSWVRPDQFFPINSNSSNIESSAVVSQTTKPDGNGGITYYSLVTFNYFDKITHTVTIVNELYKSDNDSKALGKQVPLHSYQPYAEYEETHVFQNMAVPLVAYFKSAGKNNKNLESPLGVGIVANSQHMIDDLNTANDMLQRELELSRRRVMISKEAIRPIGDTSSTRMQSSQGAYFDADDDTFIGLPNTNGDPSQPFVEQLESHIQVDEYNKAIQSYMERFENEIGLSQGTLSVNAKQSDKTATEVVSDNSMTYRTRSSYCSQVEKQIKCLIMAIIELSVNDDYGILDERLNGINPLEDDITIKVDFNDGVFTDSDTKEKNDLNMVTNMLMSKQTFMMKNLGYTEDEAKQELLRIQDEAGGFDTLPSEQKGMFGDSEGGE